MRILVTGSRNWNDLDAIREAILAATIGYRYENVTIVHGAANGADTIASQIADKLHMNQEAYPADWKEYGRAAGPLRNQEMVDLGADLCLAFLQEGSKGTADCIKRARRARIPVTIYKEKNA
jgi:hypothetical protein